MEGLPMERCGQSQWKVMVEDARRRRGDLLEEQWRLREMMTSMCALLPAYADTNATTEDLNNRLELSRKCHVEAEICGARPNENSVLPGDALAWRQCLVEESPSTCGIDPPGAISGIHSKTTRIARSNFADSLPAFTSLGPASSGPIIDGTSTPEIWRDRAINPEELRSRLLRCGAGDYDASEMLGHEAQDEGKNENNRVRALLVGLVSNSRVQAAAPGKVNTTSSVSDDAEVDSSDVSGDQGTQKPWTADIVTLMVRNIPARLTVAELSEIWPAEGSYNILHLPYSHKLKRTTGIAIVNFVSHSAACRFRDEWQGKRIRNGSKCLSIVAADVQGFVAHINMIKNSKKINSIRNAKYMPLILQPDGTAMNDSSNEQRHAWDTDLSVESPATFNHEPVGMPESCVDGAKLRWPEFDVDPVELGFGNFYAGPENDVPEMKFARLGNDRACAGFHAKHRGPNEQEDLEQKHASLVDEERRLKEMITSMCALIPKCMDYNGLIEDTSIRLQSQVDNLAGTELNVCDEHAASAAHERERGHVQIIFDKIMTLVADTIAEVTTEEMCSQTCHARVSSCLNNKPYTHEIVPIDASATHVECVRHDADLSAMFATDWYAAAPAFATSCLMDGTLTPEIWEDSALDPIELRSSLDRFIAGPAYDNPGITVGNDTQNRNSVESVRVQPLPIGLVSNSKAQLSSKLISEDTEFDAYDISGDQGTQTPLAADIVTLMVRNIPARLTVAELSEIWPAEGSYNILHLPYSHKLKRTTGIAIVNFVSHSAACRFRDEWEGRNILHCSKGLSIVAADVQGFSANINMLQNSKKISSIRNGKYMPLILPPGQIL